MSDVRVQRSDVRKIFVLSLLISVTCSLSSAARAQLDSSSKQPIDITADQTLEWHRAQLQYVAKGNAVAKQGTAQVQGDTLIADYRQDATSHNDIYRITAIGHVILTSDANTAVGDHAVYNLDTGIAVMTGQHLKMTSPDQIVTCRDNFTYDANDDRVDANGRAKAVRTMDNGDVDIITADKLSAWFPQDEFTGERALEKLGARGHVVLTTPKDVLYGDKGDYRAGNHIATVSGHAKLVQGPNIIIGDHGQLDTITNLSQMMSAPGTTRQVHGIFYPSSNKNPPAAPTKPNTPVASAAP